MDNRGTDRAVARALLSIGAVGFSINEPITFKSGIKSPVYCDNRRFPFHHTEWTTIIKGFDELLGDREINYDVVAGVEAAGIPHSSALGFYSHTPSVFVRKGAKDHGTKKLVEGGDVAGKRVVLVEDLVSTGGSSLDAVRALRNEGAIVEDTIVIVSYDFPEAREAFQKESVTLHALTTFPVILEEALALNKVSAADAAEVIAWQNDPHNWRT